jgi:HAD superfamily hydrolase (TIGR01484 family)
VDFDRTLTDYESRIPQRNLEAIEYFVANGGKFTVNTGRSTATFWQYLDTLPVNAPFLLYNGSAAWEKGKLLQQRLIDLDVWQTMDKMVALFPDMTLEIQGEKVHYLIHDAGGMEALYENLQWRWERASHGQDVGPFLKFALWGTPEKPVVSSVFSATREEENRFSQVEDTLRKLYGDQTEVFRAAPRIIDVHAKGVSKLAAARRLQQELGAKILVCVGDAENDIPMLDGADYAFCPADGVVADRYETVCPCAEGAVAEVIYKKIPKILAIKP